VIPPLALRHVVITGAAGAIGAALARAMRQAWPAARLALVDRDAAALGPLARELGEARRDAAALGPLARELGEARRDAAALGPLARELGEASATCHVADLRDVAALPALVARIAASHAEPIDGLVNCAGVMQVQQLASWDWADADALLAIDLLAPLRLQDLIVRALVARGAPGLIVNVASMAGRVPLRGCAYYGAAKAGLAMASEIARADLAEHGIRVVTVYPGPVKSSLEQGARDAYGGGGLLGRLAPTGEPGELARRIVAAVLADEPRVIYPRAYGVGWTAPNLSSWLALSYGPPPVH
jgi:3-hydroxybutyrate dehydrogenase